MHRLPDVGVRIAAWLRCLLLTLNGKALLEQRRVEPVVRRTILATKRAPWRTPILLACNQLNSDQVGDDLTDRPRAKPDRLSPLRAFPDEPAVTTNALQDRGFERALGIAGDQPVAAVATEALDGERGG